MRAQLKPAAKPAEPTAHELRAAYDRARLADTGTDFDTAMKDPALRKCLVKMAQSDRKWAGKARAAGNRWIELTQGDDK